MIVPREGPDVAVERWYEEDLHVRRSSAWNEVSECDAKIFRRKRLTDSAPHNARRPIRADQVVGLHFKFASPESPCASVLDHLRHAIAHNAYAGPFGGVEQVFPEISPGDDGKRSLGLHADGVAVAEEYRDAFDESAG